MPQTLTQKSKSERIEAVNQEIKAKIEKRGYLNYVPNPSQKRVHMSTSFERWVFAGNGTGKDAALANETGWHCLGDYPPWYPKEGRINPNREPIRARICCTNFNDGINGIIIPEFYKWFKGYFNYREKDRLVVFKETGSTIQLKTYDQDTDSYAGANLHFIGMSEHCPQDKYEENLIRLRGQGPRRLLAEMTPTEGMTWEYDEIYEKHERRLRTPPDLDIIRGCTADNIENLSEAYVERFNSLPEDQKRIRLYGDFVSLSGLVYKEYRDWMIDERKDDKPYGGHLVNRFDIPAHWPRSMCIDPHNRKPFAMLWRAISPDGTCYYYDEFKPDKGGLLVKDYADIIRQKEGKLHKQIGYRLIDTPARIQDPITGLDIQQEFARCGIYTSVVRKAAKSVDPGIHKIQQGLRFEQVPLKPNVFAPRIAFFKDLHNLRYEMKHWVWDEYARLKDKHDPKEKPVKKNDDLLDCLKYLEMTGNRYEAPALVRPTWAGRNPYGC